jgi:FG-GAP-like repeat
VVGRGDFNGDGFSDILWQNTSGQATIWEMNGTNILSAGTAGPNPGPSWQAIGTGDFNDDGHSDILWQNANGQAAMWEMNGTNILSAGTVGDNSERATSISRYKRASRLSGETAIPGFGQRLHAAAGGSLAARLDPSSL